MKKIVNKLMIVAAATFIFSQVLSADLIDVDNDGLNDVIVAEKSNGSWDFSAYTSSSGFASKTALVTGFGKKKDKPVAAEWDSSAFPTFTPGALKVRKGNFVWKSANNPSGIAIGKRKHTIALGFDYNGDGTTDLAVVKGSGDFSVFNGPDAGGTEIVAHTFAKKLARKQIPVVVPNDGSPVLGFVRANTTRARKKNRARSKLSFVAEDAAKNDVSVSLGSLQGRIVAAFPIALPGSASMNGLLVAMKKSGGYTIRVFDLSGNVIATKGIRSKINKLLIGNFSNESGHEIIIVSKSNSRLYNLFSDSVATLGKFAGRVLPENTIYSPAKSKSSGSSSSGSSNSGSTGGAGIGSVCNSLRSLSTGVLWKPDSDVSDNRGGKPVVLFQGGHKPRTSAINIYAINGTQIGRFTFKAPNEHGINNGSDHYYSGWVGGSSETGGQLAAEASAAAGSPNVYFTGPGGSCYGPVHPDGRSGGIS